MSFVRFPLRFGKYIILDRVSSGGMAEVYRAKAIGLQNIERLVAIKRMLPAVMRDKSFVPMFIDEAKLVAQLSHPNIAQTYELGSTDDGLFIAMELVHGRDLNYLLKLCRERHVEVPVAFAAYVGSKAAEALDFAHRAVGYDGAPLNLVHRDVSPQNILIAYEGQVKIVDFGIAKADLRSTKTMPGMLKGKLSYMAPEQALEGTVDRRTDIFCLGIVLWETLAGRRLFEGDNALVILERICHLPIPTLRDEAPRVPEALAAVVDRCLERDPTARYQTADEVVDALAPFLIEERSIFGEKGAAELMRSLLPQEIEETQARLKRYREINEADCVQEHEGAGATTILAGLGITTEAADRPPSPQQPTAPAYGGETEMRTAEFTSETSGRITERNFPPPETFAEELQSADEAAHGAFDADRMRGRGVALGALAGLALAAGGWLALRGRDAPAPVAPQPAVSGPSLTPTPPPQPEPPPEPPPAAQPPAPTPAPAPAEAKPAAPSWGYLSVRADTDKPAKIFIDGKEVGYSPVLNHRLRAGTHQLKIVIPDDRASTTVREVKIGAEHKRGKPLRLVIIPGT